MAVSLTDQAEVAILGLLTGGELVVGDRLSIRRLTRVTHYGFMPIQDALKRLHGKGWVAILNPQKYGRKGGTYVLRTA